jgi:SNF2 family DNA or RNA helicase
VHILRSGQTYDIAKCHGGSFPDIVVTNYHKLHHWASVLSPDIKAVVFDEVHELRHKETKKYKAACLIAHSTGRVIGLSATPIFNMGSEIFTVMEVVRPGALGKEEAFIRKWCLSDHNRKRRIEYPDALGRYLRKKELLLRRTRKDVQRELAEVIVVSHYIDADIDVMESIRIRALNLARLVLGRGDHSRKKRNMAAMQLDQTVRQATGIAKAPHVAKFVKSLCEETGEKVLLFGWHRAVYDIWLKDLAHLQPSLYTGTESLAQKTESQRAFAEGNSQVLIVSNRSGAGLEGLQNICHIGVVGELDYSPAVHIQGQGRLNRDGQQNIVLTYFLLARCGSDPIIESILNAKQKQLEGINNPYGEEGVNTKQVESYYTRLAEQILRANGESIPVLDEAVTPSY